METIENNNNHLSRLIDIIKSDCYKISEVKFFLTRYPDYYKELEKKPNSVTPLMVAASLGKTEIVKLLIEKEAGKLDEYGLTALMYAASHNHYECVSLLVGIESGAIDTYNHSALLYAIYNNHFESMNLLIPYEMFLDYSGLDLMEMLKENMFSYAENECIKYIRNYKCACCGEVITKDGEFVEHGFKHYCSFTVSKKYLPSIESPTTKITDEKRKEKNNNELIFTYANDEFDNFIKEKQPQQVIEIKKLSNSTEIGINKEEENTIKPPTPENEKKIQLLERNNSQKECIKMHLENEVLLGSQKLDTQNTNYLKKNNENILDIQEVETTSSSVAITPITKENHINISKNEEINIRYSDTLEKNKLNNTISYIYCSGANNGCNYKIVLCENKFKTIEKLLDHENNCKYIEVNCYFKKYGCKCRLVRYALDEHAKNCKYCPQYCDICENIVPGCKTCQHTKEE